MFSFSSLSYLYQLCLLFSCKSSTFLSNLTHFILLCNSYLALSDTVKACFIVFDLLLMGNPLTTLASQTTLIFFHLQARQCSGGPPVLSWSSALVCLLSSKLSTLPWFPLVLLSAWYSSLLSEYLVFWNCLDLVLLCLLKQSWLYILPVIFIALWFALQVWFSFILYP